MTDTWMLMTCFSLLIPLTMLIFGIVFYVHPPMMINRFYGYRTLRSMKDETSWHLAHKLIAKLWTWLGIISITITLIIMIILINSAINKLLIVMIILCFVQLCIMITPIFFVEKRLNEHQIVNEIM